MPLLVLLAVIALIVVLAVLVWRHRRRTLTGVAVGSFVPTRGMEVSGVGMPPGAKITRARRRGEGVYDLSVTRDKGARFTDGSWGATDPSWAVHWPLGKPDPSPRSMTIRVIGNRPLEVRNVQLLDERGPLHGGANPTGWDAPPIIGEHVVTEAQIERGWVDVADPTA